MDENERVIITAPPGAEPGDMEYEALREALANWKAGCALVLPPGWIYEVVRADTPVVVNGDPNT